MFRCKTLFLCYVLILSLLVVTEAQRQKVKGRTQLNIDEEESIVSFFWTIKPFKKELHTFYIVFLWQAFKLDEIISFWLIWPEDLVLEALFAYYSGRILKIILDTCFYSIFQLKNQPKRRKTLLSCVSLILKSSDIFSADAFRGTGASWACWGSSQHRGISVPPGRNSDL